MNLTFAGPDGIIILSVFAIAMLLIGYFSGRGETNLHHSLSNYYLAGKNLGFIALFFTLYATQYSGNTIVGYAPTAYRTGFSWLQSISFMTIIIGIYLLFAPRLYVISKRQNFVTPTDWLQFRFKSKAVTLLSIFLMLWGLGNYLLEQLVAIGQAVSGMTGGTIPYEIAVLVFVVVMLVYEWMGGMKAVAFTDVLQGIILMIGIFVFLGGALYLVGGHFPDVTRFIADTEPAKVAVPTMDISINWFSMLVLVGLGASIYPHAVQRIYSAESERTLKKSFARMAWMPPITTGLVFVVGIIGLMLYPGLDKSGSEQLVGLMANDIAAINPFFYWMMIIFFGGIVAAIISTADSVLLSFSSMLSNDVYGKFINPGASEHKKVMVGKIGGIIAVFGLLWIAWNPPGTLYDIFVLKFELLVQVFPAFVLGLYWKRLSGKAVFWGMLAGAVLAGFLTLTGHKTVFGIHGGVLGLGLNFFVCLVGSLIIPATAKSSLKDEELAVLEMRA
ncbi:sodium:solute symporter family protein [Mesobacillus sp. AQ2]|jgi:solute:Na+ symporter, SSS family|uniref:sodium:solute symporter family protein n=1 Tax=unclassified Mesobacillus TaxID=2675270 RepID=UPI00203EFE15|nr:MULTISPECIES: sodium:solute symporter family protein [unclassified Mesobacillus]MCM3122911.1 sodium:solute symporter family protein [Mesobacillus sp. MER 33]MCM3233606.1 sodium:solute symporter family protein [Mesobacillus sp. MER 48]WHX42642.1 sodium:solute symporter family protein [Mesobacillus sp. AQ2]